MGAQVNEARGAKDTLGILFWGVLHKRFGVITSWDICYDLKYLLSNVEQFKPLCFISNEATHSLIEGPDARIHHCRGHFGDDSRTRSCTTGLDIRLVRIAHEGLCLARAVGLVFSFLVSDNYNNMPSRRSSATARAIVAAAAAAAPMTAAAIE
ncbi:hypothetical protein Tco_1283276 [Tanacetum coccineum]